MKILQFGLNLKYSKFIKNLKLMISHLNFSSLVLSFFFFLNIIFFFFSKDYYSSLLKAGDLN